MSLDGYKISESGRHRKRISSVSKTGRSLLPLMVAVVCALLLTGRLLWCFTYLINGDETGILVGPHRTNTSRADAGVLGNRESHGSIKVEEIFPRAAVQEEVTRDNEEEFEDDIKDNKADGIEGSSEGMTYAEEKLEVETKIGEETTETVNIDLNPGDEGEIDEEEALTRDNEDQEGSVRMDKFPDAIAYLEELAANLTSKGVEDDDGPYHSRRIFESDFAAMKRNFRIFVYPHDERNPFHVIFQATNAKKLPWAITQAKSSFTKDFCKAVS